MMERTLKNLIEKYSNKHLSDFFYARNDDFQPLMQAEPSYDDDQFMKTTLVGQIRLSSGEDLPVWAFKVGKNLTQRSGKLDQYNKARNILNDKLKYAGIFVFHDSQGNFRFSFIYRTPLGTKVVGSNYKRFTYFVSPELTNNTFRQRFGKEAFLSRKSIEEAFSVEPVTTQFFNEFRTIFEKTIKEFKTANKNTVIKRLESKYNDEEQEEQIKKFVFTFLGRIIFLYFLLRKAWVEGRSDYIRTFVEDKTNHALYQTLFEPLFFEVFAVEEKNRSPEIKERFRNTPYLNGGLFEHSELELEMKKEGIQILFRDAFLRDIILNFFETYNFTTDENLPYDQEVSIDPEMLGKVFENSLAEAQRKRKGTFYTPREIVHYMVRNSIYQYLLNETTVPPKLIRELVFEPEAELVGLTVADANLMDEKLNDVKVLDPSVGSGAFPVEFMNQLIQLRKRLNVKVGTRVNEVTLKKRIIKNNLYGVDIDPGAIEIAKLRLWLSLIVDYDISLVEPLPSLDFQFRVGNSLQETIDGIDVFKSQSQGQQISLLEEDMAVQNKSAEMIRIKDEFYAANNEEHRHKLKKQFDLLEQELIQSHLDNLRSQHLSQAMQRSVRDRVNAQKTLKRIEALEQKIEDGTYKLFKPDFHFSEVFQRKDARGFDIVIGNPPYGVRVDNALKDEHGLGSRDSYGVFISTAIKRFLKPGGVLEFIVSDTWLTIKSHRSLRKQVLETTLHKVLRLHPDCFDAVVNVNILSLTNRKPEEDAQLLVADLTNHSTRSEAEELQEILNDLGAHVGTSTSKYAVYQYPQSLPLLNTNYPIFVGSPKLFLLMRDVDVPVVDKLIDGKRIAVRQIEFNGKIVEIVRFGDIAEVKVGLQTGDNRSYLYQNPEARGSYRDINQFREFLVTEEELERIASNDEIRRKIIEKGFHKTQSEKNFDPERWFGGRYIVPYDKGGESDTSSGWLPNYYVPTNYFIDWSSWAVHRMQTLTMYKRDGKGSKTRLCSRFQNASFYFKRGITFSWTGIYSPLFRLSASGPFDHGSSSVFSDDMDFSFTLGVLTSKISKAFARLFINHTVNFGIDDVKEIPFINEYDKRLTSLVNKVILEQHKNPMYQYQDNEQLEIDRIVYSLYGLNNEDIKEVETWYARRYPRLAMNQRQEQNE